jgi:carboxymethylenebutenolidase
MRRERRRFIVRLAAALTAGALARSGATQVATAAGLETGYVEFGGGVRSYVARPRAAAAKLRTLIVLHGERGLNAHVEDVARRAARDGFAAIAPDLSSARGDGPISRLLALTDEVAARADSGTLGCVGFSSGGTLALQLAARRDNIAGAVAFYAAVPPVLEVPRIKARVLLHFAENDPEINTGVPAYEAALNAAGVQNAIHVYPGTGHDFHDDSVAARHQAEAAALAWSRTLAFLKDALP